MRKLHRILGLCLMVPMFFWSITGMIFLIKPGYEGAYQRLEVKTYPLVDSLAIQPHVSWHEFKVVRTVIGTHYLVKKNGVYQQIDPENGALVAPPSDSAIIALLSDAISTDLERYGEIKSVSGQNAETTTGINVSLNWDSLTLTQRGWDRAVIETLYKIHYLEWTKWEGSNWALAVFGLGGLFSITFAGIWIYVLQRKIANR